MNVGARGQVSEVEVLVMGNMLLQHFNVRPYFNSSALCSYLSDRSLRVEHEVAECSLENPSELGQEAGVVRDGSGGSSGSCLLTLNYPL